MNKQTLFVTLTTAALMCGCQSSKVKISGRFVGGDAKNIYLEQVLPLTQSVVDSAALAPDGSYRMELTGVAKTPSLYNVIYDGERIPLLLAGGDRLTLGSVGSVIRNYTVEGSSESELLRQFYQAFVTGAQQLENMGTEFARKLTDEERKSLIKEYTAEYYRIRREQLRFIIEHKASLAAVYALYQRLPGDTYLFNGDSDVVYYRTVAEALQESSEWKQATEELIALQGKWSKIGPVPRRYSDQIWKRFRAACDRFFERKSQHFSQVEGEHEENLRRKLALIEEMRTADVKAGGYDVIRDFQRRWSEIGFVPIKQKDAVQKSYKEVVDAMFDALRGSERDRSMSRFRDRLQLMKSSGDKRLRSERERLYNKVRQLEQDIALLENNVGFFSKSKNAEAVVADIREKIAASKQQLQDMIEKVRLIDSRAAEEAKTDAADPKEEKPAKENKD